MTRLTDRQRLVLDYIRESIATRGMPPTLREIAQRIGIVSTNGVVDHLRALERKGYIRRDAVTARGIVLLEQGKRLTAPTPTPKCEAQEGALSAWVGVAS